MLLQLPPDILAQILSSKHSFLVIQLWKCGDRTLDHLLSNRACIEVDLVDENSWSTSRWPKMLRHLRQLRKLRIIRGHGGLMPMIDLINEIKHLSPTLESLTIEAESAELSLFNFAGPIDSTRQYAYEFTSYPRGASRIWNIGSFFPRLHTLKLVSFERKYGEDPRFQDEDLAALPDTITNLKLYHCELGYEPKDCNPSTLPPNLLRLRALKSWRTEVSILSLPSSITELKLFNDTLCSPEQAAAIPRGVIQLGSHIYWAPGLLEKLPLGVDKLRFGQCRELQAYADLQPFWNSLPSHLTEIRMLYALRQRLLRVHEIAALPRTLHTLTLACSFDWRAMEDGLSQSAWPPQLHSLRFESSAESLPTGLGAISYFQCWPRSLTRVEAGDFFARFPIDMRHLPQGLRYLQINIHDQKEEWISVDSTGILPPTLTDLTLQTDPILYPRFKYPDTLLSLDISALADSADDEDPNRIIWPKNLKTLNLQPSHMSTVAMLPSSLKSLTLVSLTGSKDYEAKDGETTIHDAGEFGDAISSLTQLETLSLDDTWTSFDELLLFRLPRTLKSLYCRLESLSDEGVISMPRSLHYAHILVEEDSNVTTTPQVLDYWPPHCRITDELGRQMGLGEYVANFPYCQHPDPRVTKRLQNP